MTEWTPQTWRSRPVGQTVEYLVPSPSSSSGERDPDPVVFKRKQGLESVAQKLETLPPLVSAVEVRPPACPLPAPPPHSAPGSLTARAS